MSVLGTERFQSGLEQLKRNTGVEIEIILGIPVFIIKNDNNVALSQIIEVFGDQTVIRVINADFVDDALESGTDKKHIDEHDYRRLIHGVGYDIHGVETKAKEMGLKNADVFCGRAHDYFIRGKFKYTFTGFGIPEDRSAVLIYDRRRLRVIEGTDGYTFVDLDDKRSALLGVIKFRESLIEFEKELNSLASTDEKIALLEREIQNLNKKSGLERIFYLALNVIRLICRESLLNASQPSTLSDERMKKLRAMASQLECERKIVEFIDDMEDQLRETRKAFDEKDSEEMELAKLWPNSVISDVGNLLQSQVWMDDKYKAELIRLIEEAEQCKIELGLEI